MYSTDQHYVPQVDASVTKQIKKPILKDKAGLVPKKVPVHIEGKTFEAIRWIRPKTLEEIKRHGKERKIAIPPAWTDVRIAKDPKNPLQAVGKDSKGRIQYLYSKKHSEKAAVEKFRRIRDFMKAYPRIQERIMHDMNSKQEAQILYLIDKTAFRIGKDRDTQAEKKAYGVTTLLGKHVAVKGDSIHFSFVGKKGVQADKTIKDPILRDIIIN